MTKAAEKDFVETPETVSSVFDFATRDSAAKAEEGAELKVVDPLTGDGVGVSSRLPELIPPSTARRRPRSPNAA